MVYVVWLWIQVELYMLQRGTMRGYKLLATTKLLCTTALFLPLYQKIISVLAMCKITFDAWDDTLSGHDQDSW